MGYGVVGVGFSASFDLVIAHLNSGIESRDPPQPFQTELRGGGVMLFERAHICRHYDNFNKGKKLALKIAINGYGRIGRSVARIVSKREDVELVAINDLADLETIEYLTRYDSVHGPLDEEVGTEEGRLLIGTDRIEVFREPDPAGLRFADVGAEVVLECSGRFLRSDIVDTHIRHGAKRVIISAPAEDDTPTYVFGVNAHEYRGEPVISNASCTTNCLGPIARIVDEVYGIESGLMTTIHAYTGGQSLMDAATSKDMRRCRAAAVNIVPTTTHAAEAIYKVLPSLKGRLHGCIVAEDLTQVVGANMLKVMAWYDNEWGYANRLVEMALHIMK